MDTNGFTPNSIPAIDAEISTQPQLAAGLYVVATPIGNLRDITVRALDVLRQADVILCEDTRVTAKLCTAYGITTPRIAYHDHSGEGVTDGIVTRLAQGQALALVSDAGTPLIADPGFDLIAACRNAGIPVYSVPGPSAVVAGLSVSGMPTDRFYFAGFLPPKIKARRDRLMGLASVDATLVFYEAPHRLLETLSDMRDVLPHRRVAVAREITKKFEEVTGDDYDSVIESYTARGDVKGEIVIMLSPPDAAATTVNDADVETMLETALKTGQSVKDAAAEIAAATGRRKSDVYTLALGIKDRLA